MSQELREFAAQPNTPVPIAAAALSLVDTLEQYPDLIPTPVATDQTAPLSLPAITKLCQKQEYLVAAFAIMGLNTTAKTRSQDNILTSLPLANIAEHAATTIINLPYGIRILCTTDISDENSLTILALTHDDTVYKLTRQEKELLKLLVTANKNGENYTDYDTLAKAFGSKPNVINILSRLRSKIDSVFDAKNDDLSNRSSGIIETINERGVKSIAEGSIEKL